MNKIFWFDCETTGLLPDQHGIVQLAFMVEIDGKIVHDGQVLMDPSMYKSSVDEDALKIHGRTIADIKSYQAANVAKIEIERVLAAYVDRFDSKDKFMAAGYNVNFDMGFLRQLWVDTGDKYFGSWFQFAKLDPVQIIGFMKYIGKMDYNGSMKLAELAAYFGVAREGAHDARTDIHITREIVQQIRNAFK